MLGRLFSGNDFTEFKGTGVTTRNAWSGARTKEMGLYNDKNYWCYTEGRTMNTVLWAQNEPNGDQSPLGTVVVVVMMNITLRVWYIV